MKDKAKMRDAKIQCESEGIELLEVTHARKHRKLLVRYRGVVGSFPISLSGPGNRRDSLNRRTQLRQWKAEVDARINAARVRPG